LVNFIACLNLNGANPTCIVNSDVRISRF